MVAKGTSLVIAADAADNVAMSKVEFYIDANLKCSDSLPRYECRWNVPGKSNVQYKITAKAYDTSGNIDTHFIYVTVR